MCDKNDIDEIKNDVKTIRESQIRMEEDVKYHIRRTDVLEELHRDNQNRIEILESDKDFKSRLKRQVIEIGKLLAVVATAIALYKSLS